MTSQRPVSFPGSDPVRPAAGKSRRLLLRLTGAALFTCAGAAAAGGGAGVLNALASLRGHQGPVDLPYGPLARQRFDVYRPGRSARASDKATGTPLVIFLPGGSWSTGDRRDYRFAGEALAAQGFTVMVADYRLYPQARYPAFLQDCAKAVGYGLDHAAELGADPRRVFVFGHSAGAYNAAMMALDPRWLREVGHAPNDLAGWVGLAGPYDFLPIHDPVVKLVFDWPGTSPDTQPINHVDDVRRPLPAFLGAAEHDRVVDPLKNTAQLASNLRDHGAAVTYKLYEHVNHATLAGALSWPLTFLAPVLDDTADFIRSTAPAQVGPVSPPLASAAR
jgi:acetyl esterase/lipase